MPRSLHLALWITLSACGSAESAPLVRSADGPVSASSTGGETDYRDPQTPADVTGSLGQLPEDRRLVRTGSLNVAVDAFDPFHNDLQSWLATTGGYIADTTISRSEGAVGHATLRVRVPSSELETLVGWTREKVEVEHLSIQSQDVTAQWVDQAARLEALEVTQTRLLQLTAHNTGNLADVLAAERELSRVRGDIESMERQHRALKDQVQLASLTLSVRVRQPLITHVSQTLGAETSKALGVSLALMAQLARGLVISVVALAPWALLGAVPMVLLALLVRFAVRRTARR